MVQGNCRWLCERHGLCGCLWRCHCQDISHGISHRKPVEAEIHDSTQGLDLDHKQGGCPPWSLWNNEHLTQRQLCIEAIPMHVHVLYFLLNWNTSNCLHFQHPPSPIPHPPGKGDTFQKETSNFDSSSKRQCVQKQLFSWCDKTAKMADRFSALYREKNRLCNFLLQEYRGLQFNVTIKLSVFISLCNWLAIHFKFSSREENYYLLSIPPLIGRHRTLAFGYKAVEFWYKSPLTHRYFLSRFCL